MASEVVIASDPPPAAPSPGSTPPQPNGGSSASSSSSQSDMSIIAMPTEANDNTFTHVPWAVQDASPEKLHLNPQALKLIRILAIQNKQLKDSLVANNAAWQRQLEVVAHQKQQYESALKGSGERACAVVTSLMQTWSPPQTQPDMPASGGPGCAADSESDTDALQTELQRLRAQCSHLEQEKKALLQINQDLERGCGAGGSPGSDNGFLLVEQPGDQEQEPPRSTAGASDQEARLQEQLKESIASARTLEARLEEQNAEILRLGNQVQESIGQVEQLEVEKRTSAAQVQRFQEQVQGLQQQVQSLLAELYEKNGQLQAMSKKYQDLQMGSDHTLSELDTKILQRDERIHSLETMLLTKEREYKQQSQKLYTDVQHSKAELNKSLSELATRQAALQELRKDHHDMLVKNQSAKDALLAENLAFKQERVKFQGHLNALKKDLDKQLSVNRDLEENVQLFRMQAECFQSDFEAERKAREDLHSEKLQLKERLEQYDIIERDKAAGVREEAGQHSLQERMRRHAPERYRQPPRQQQNLDWEAQNPPPAAQQPWTLVPKNRRHMPANEKIEPLPPERPLDRQAVVQELICPMCGAESPDDDSFQLHLNDCIK